MSSAYIAVVVEPQVAVQVDQVGLDAATQRRLIGQARECQAVQRVRLASAALDEHQVPAAFRFSTSGSSTIATALRCGK